MKLQMSRILKGALLVACLGFLSSSTAGWVSGSKSDLQFKLFIPDTIANSGKLPIVWYMHPNGWQGNQYDGTMNNVDKDTLPNVLARPDSQAHHPCFVFAPECPNNKYWVKFASSGTGWGPTTYSISDPTTDTSVLSNVISVVDSLVKRYSRIDTNRIHIAGGSMGGYATLYLMCKFPAKFASATAMSFAGDTSRAKLLTRVPTWFFWGTNDNICPVAGNVIMKNAIINAGADTTVVRFKPFSGSGHLWNQVWCYDQSTYFQRGLINWMFSQSKTTSAIQPDRQQALSSQTAIQPLITLTSNGLSILAHENLTLTLLMPSGRVVSQHSIAAGKKMAIPLSATTGMIYLQFNQNGRQSIHSMMVNR